MNENTKLTALSKILEDNDFIAKDKICICLPDISEKNIADVICKDMNLEIFILEVTNIDEDQLTTFLNDNKVKGLIIADWISINDKFIPTKTVADRASINVPTLEKIFVVKHLNKSISWLDGRDVWF